MSEWVVVMVVVCSVCLCSNNYFSLHRLDFESPQTVREKVIYRVKFDVQLVFLNKYEIIRVRLENRQFVILPLGIFHHGNDGWGELGFFVLSFFLFCVFILKANCKIIQMNSIKHWHTVLNYGFNFRNESSVKQKVDVRILLWCREKKQRS
jgi:hypothetical protein